MMKLETRSKSARPRLKGEYHVIQGSVRGPLDNDNRVTMKTRDSST